jgi:hypothetical protein
VFGVSEYLILLGVESGNYSLFGTAPLVKVLLGAQGAVVTCFVEKLSTVTGLHQSQLCSGYLASFRH